MSNAPQMLVGSIVRYCGCDYEIISFPATMPKSGPVFRGKRVDGADELFEDIAANYRFVNGVWKTREDYYQDGANFYKDDDSGELLASYPELVKNDYDLDGAAAARAKFIDDHFANEEDQAVHDDARESLITTQCPVCGTVQPVAMRCRMPGCGSSLCF